MIIPKSGKVIAGAFVLLLSVLVLTWIGVSHNSTTPVDDEDRLTKGYRLFLAQKFEEAYGNFRVAWCLAATVDYCPERAMKALNGMGDCAFWMGEVDSCIYRYQKAVVLAHELNMPYEEYDIYTKLKQAYMTKVDMGNVLFISQKIDSLISTSTNVRLKIGLQQRLATEALQQQNPKLAEHYLLTNEKLLDSLLADERQSQEFEIYGNLRDFYYGQQNIDKARRYSKKIIEAGKCAFKQNQISYMQYGWEAIFYAQQQDRHGAFEALDSMKYGLSLKNGESPVNVMYYYDTKGQVHAMFGEWEKACKAYRQSLAAVENTNAVGRADYFRVIGLLGTALSQIKKYDEARACYAELAQYNKYQYGEKSLAFADALWNMANFEGHCNEIKAGKEYYIRSIDICKDLVASQMKYISVQERNAFWMNFAPKMWAMAAYALKIGEAQSLFTEKCYEALLFSKALLLESDRTLAIAINKECTPEERQVYYEMQNLQAQQKALMSDYEKNKKQIEELHKKISYQNQRLTPIISKIDYTSFLTQDYKDIKQSLNDDEVLLDFTDFVTDEQLYQHVAYVIARQQMHPKMVSVFTEDEVKILLKGKPLDFMYKEPYASKALKVLWEPLEDAVKGKSTIYYVPSGMMHKIALESIPMKDGTLLGEHFHFVRLTSAREIARLRQKDQHRLQKSATLYGALRYTMDAPTMVDEASHYKVEPLLAINRGEVTKGEEGFGELPNAKEEIGKIEQILRHKHLKVNVHTGTKGTEESFLSLSGKAPNILHIATHGFYYTKEKANEVDFLKGYSDAMMLSGLIMSGGNMAWTGRQPPKGVMGGVLTANQIALLDLKGTDLLVLSACQTGLGVSTPEGLYGLQRAFKKAGVQTMVMTLWSIQDEVAKEFMIKFYEELAENNWDKRKAFENAKSYIRHSTKFKDPYYWAGFVMLD